MMQQMKQDLLEVREIVKDMRDAPDTDGFARACYSCQVWGLNRMIGAIDVVRYVKHLLRQKQK
jgi:hypothetical protein